MGMVLAEEGSLVYRGKEPMDRPGLVSVAGSLADLAVEERKSLVWGILFCSWTWIRSVSHPDAAAVHRLTWMAFCIFHSLPCSHRIDLQRRCRHHNLDVPGMDLFRSVGSGELAGIAEVLAAAGQWFLAGRICQQMFLSLPVTIQLFHFHMERLGPMQLLLAWAEWEQMGWSMAVELCVGHPPEISLLVRFQLERRISA